MTVTYSDADTATRAAVLISAVVVAWALASGAWRRRR